MMQQLGFATLQQKQIMLCMLFCIICDFDYKMLHEMSIIVNLSIIFVLQRNKVLVEKQNLI